jgi:plastocyanin
VTISVGETVTWENTDNAAHTVTSGSPADGPDGVFDSSMIMAGGSYSHTFDSAGAFDYFCMVHPWMEGSVIVEGEESTDSEATPEPESTSENVIVTNALGSSTPGCEPNCFIPSTVTISVGETVTWENVDNAAHTATSGTPADGPSGHWDSSLVMAGSSFSKTFELDGTYHYFCMVHPWMLGTVIVGDGSPTRTSEPAPIPAPIPEPTIPSISSLSVTTNNMSYDLGNMVSLDIELNGAGTGENIAVSVQQPNGSIILSRTVTTNSFGQADLQFSIGNNYQAGTYTVQVTSSAGGNTFSDSLTFTVSSAGGISITSVQSTDQQGNPVSSFSIGNIGYVKVVLFAESNTSSLVTVNLFDSDLTSLGVGSFKTTLSEGQSEIILSFFIPNDAVAGTAEIFANTYTDWPSQGGTPLTAESSTNVGL